MKLYTTILIMFTCSMASCSRPHDVDFLQGTAGVKGDKGDAGQNGQSCTVTTLGVTEDAPNGGAIIKCGTDSTLILNGTNGVDGQDGTNGTNGTNGHDGQDAVSTYNIVALVDPCGDSQGIIDEIFLRLGNGTLVALFADNSNGDNPRLSVLVDGSYITTDGSSCHFSIATSGHTRTLSWTGGSYSYTF